jgi:alpha-galactosidase
LSKKSVGALSSLTILLSVASILPVGAQAPASEPRDGQKASIHVRTKPRLGLRVVSGSLVYEEHLLKGGLRTRFWSPNGLIKPDVFLESEVSTDFTGDEIPNLDDPMACVFGLSVDGQDLWDHWAWKSADEAPCEADPAVLSRDDGLCRHMVVELVSEIRPIRVKVHTQVDGHPFMRRWLEIINDGKAPAAIGKVFPMSGYLFSAHRILENLPQDASSVFSVLKPASFAPYREDDFRFVPLPDGTFSYGASKYGTPFSIVRNEVTGESFVIYFAWSGEYAFEFLNNHHPGRGIEGYERDDAWLYFRAGLKGPGPLRVLRAGDAATTPAVHIGHMFGDLDVLVQESHKYLRDSVLPPMPPGKIRPVEINSWGFVANEVSETSLRSVIDTAADVGVELFTVDAGWYGDVKSDWWQKAGDWKTASRLPNGLEPIFSYARSKGLLCGLWVDIERIGLVSDLRKAHPDWVVTRHGSGENFTALDLTNPAALKYAEETLAGLIQRYKLDVFRLDYNTSMGPAGGQNAREGFVEKNYWRYYEAAYGMYRRLRKRFPNLMMENCAGGGGRNDLGMLGNFHWTQISDEWGGVRTLKILNGFTIPLPPEYALSYVGFMDDENYRYGDTDFRFRGQMFGHLTLGGVAPSLAEFAAAYRDKVRHDVELYKSFIRPIQPTVKVYHHTPYLPNTEAGDWCVMEHVTPDQGRGYAGIFRLAGAREGSYRFRPRGLDISATYKVTLDNSRKSVVLKGVDLITHGLEIQLAQPFRSELILFERQ